MTAIWNHAQHFALSDNHYGTTFGPSTPGAINLISGQTFGAAIANGLSGAGNIAGGGNSGAVIGDSNPRGDTCSNPQRTQITMSGTDVGDLLNEAGVTWGAFMSGFANCTHTSTGIIGLTSTDYIPPPRLVSVLPILSERQSPSAVFRRHDRQIRSSQPRI